MRKWPWAMVALGGNLGDRSRILVRAVEDLRANAGVRVLAVSRWIETEPCGGPPGQPLYLNGALHLETRHAPRALLGLLLEIERAHGRERGVANGPRTLDLDLLLYEDVTVDEPGLQVPHPGLEERLFVLEPLCDIAPDLVLPCSQRTVRERLVELRGAAT